MRRQGCGVFAAALLAGTMLASPGAYAQPTDIDPTDPFASVASADEWRDLFLKQEDAQADDPFRNLTANQWWQRTWGGQWRDAYARGMSITEFLDSIAGSGGNGTHIRSPYPYETAEEHWNAWLEAADGGTGHTRETLPDWSGDWRGGEQVLFNGAALVRDLWDAVSDAYKPAMEQNLQAELEGRSWWPSDTCRPSGFSRSAWELRYIMIDQERVILAADQPVTLYRVIHHDGRGFLPEDYAFPTWLGQSQGFWDDDQLIVWTKDIRANATGHGIPDYSDSLEIIERWAMLGDQLVADVTVYDTEALNYPLHEVAVYNRRADWFDPPVMLNECVTTNNVYRDETGRLNERAPGDPDYNDQFDPRPWTTVFDQAEAAKEAGLIEDAPSFLGELSVR